MSLKQSIKVFFPYDSAGRLDEKLINSNHRQTESNKQVERGLGPRPWAEVAEVASFFLPPLKACSHHRPFFPQAGIL